MNEQTLNEGKENPAGPSPADTSNLVPPAPAPEAVKSVTGEQDLSKAVPYERFKEVEEKAKLASLYEDVLMEHMDKLQKDPSGKLRLVIDSAKAPEKQVEEFGEEEINLLTEIHPELYNIFQKHSTYLTNQILSELQQRQTAQSEYLKQSNYWYGKARERFGGDVDNPKSELRIRAEQKIYEDGHAIRQKDGSYYIPPKAQYDAFVDTYLEFQDKVKQKETATKTMEPIKKQGKFVSSGGKGGSSTAMTKEDFAKMSPEERAAFMRQQVQNQAE